MAFSCVILRSRKVSGSQLVSFSIVSAQLTRELFDRVTAATSLGAFAAFESLVHTRTCNDQLHKLFPELFQYDRSTHAGPDAGRDDSRNLTVARLFFYKVKSLGSNLQFWTATPQRRIFKQQRTDRSLRSLCSFCCPVREGSSLL